MSNIRRAVPGDAYALHPLIEGAYRGESAKRGWTHEADLLGGQRTDVDELNLMLSDPGQIILVAEEEGRLLGCVHLRQSRPNVGYLGMLTVDPELQVGGLGRQLIAAAEAEVRTAFKARLMEMSVIASRTELIAWYQRRGYALTGERRPFPYGDERFGLPRTDALEFVVMAKALTSSERAAA